MVNRSTLDFVQVAANFWLQSDHLLWSLLLCLSFYLLYLSIGVVFCCFGHLNKQCLLTPFLWWARLSYYKLFVNNKVVHPKRLRCLVMMRMMRTVMIMVTTMKIAMMITLMVVMIVIDDDWPGALCQLDDWQTIEALLWVLAPLLVPSQSLSW